MGELCTHAGEGWLRSPAAGASTARYRLTLEDRGDGSLCVRGTIEGDLITMIEVERARHGVLVLESGRQMRVRLTGVTSGGAAFEVM